SQTARDRARRLAPQALVFADADELLARPDVDAVVITAPSGLHASLAIATLETQRHLFLEKPIASTLEEGRRVLAASRGDRVAVVGFNWRFQPLVARARELVLAGAIGEVRAMSTAFCEPGLQPGWKRARAEGGGVLLDLGSHHFDLIQWLLAAQVERVEASLRSEESDQDSASVRLLLDDGRVASSFFSFRAARAHSLELFGERGVIRIDRYARTLSLHGRRARVATPSVLAWRARAFVQRGSEPSWTLLLQGFVDAVRGAEVELPTLADGLRSLEVVSAAEHAAASS
ncbi:MAG: Gfo/Idh/MocA family oxidoreductase, partial [Actinobacteria bacterium]|nr:Gfo/Idh/MocA family oxidoreductase [Actinomycetota bacterium]